jgi:putative transposase
MPYVRFPILLRHLEDLLHERGLEVSHETVRFWSQRFGPMFAAEICERRVIGLRSSRRPSHLDEVFVRINGVQHYRWRGEGGCCRLEALCSGSDAVGRRVAKCSSGFDCFL